MRVTAQILQRDRGALRRIIDRVRGLDRLSVSVGVPPGAMHHGENGTTSMAMIATTLHYGSAAKNIPARPFIEPAINQNLGKYQRLMATQARGLIVGRQTLNRALSLVGTAMAADVQQYMLSGSFAPLQPATIRRKGSSRPLIDTGQLRQSITYRVE